MENKNTTLLIDDSNGKAEIANSDFFKSMASKEHLRYIEQDEAIKTLRRDKKTLEAELSKIKVCKYCEHGYWANQHKNDPVIFVCNLHRREEKERNTCKKWEMWK
jgi:hypothetical protein